MNLTRRGNSGLPITGGTMTGNLVWTGAAIVGLALNSLTTTQRDAISSPPAGALIWNTVTSRVNNYNGSAWTDGWVRLGGDTMTGTLEIQNGAAQQTLRVYGTYTDSGNYRRAILTMTTAGDVQLNGEGLGTGASGNSFALKLNGTTYLTITSGGATVFGGKVAAGNTNQLGWNLRSQMTSPSDGTINCTNNSANGFTALQFNGTQILTTRRTGWSAATGNATRTSFATGSVTTAALAEAVKALIDDLITHGIIGA